MYGVYFHTVHTGIPAELGGLGEGFDDLVDLFYRHFGTFDIVSPAGFLGAGAGQLVGGVQDRLEQSTCELVLVQRSHQLGDGPGSPHTGSQLYKQFRARLMNLVHKDFQFLEHLRILPEPFAPERIPQGSNAGDDQADVVIGSFQK